MFAVFGALCAIYIICVRHGVAAALFSGCAAAWFFRLRRFATFPAPYSRRGAFSSALPPFSPAVLCFAAADRRSAAYAVSAFAVRYFCRNRGRILRRQTAAVAKGCFSGLSKRPSFDLQKVVFCSPKGYLLHAERPPFRKLLFGASGIASRQPSGQGRAVPRLGHPEGIIRGVRRSEILLLFIVRNIKFCLKVNLCPDFVSYYLSVGSNVFA